MAELEYAERVGRFKQALHLVTDALRGQAKEPLALDPAIAACKEAPVPVVSAAQSLGAVRRAAGVGIGVLYDSLQTIERMREVTDAYLEAGGESTRIAIRRVWIGPPPEAEVEAQMDFYRGYASQGAQAHWGEGQQLVAGANGAEVAEQLLEIADRGGCDAFNLRVHVKGIEPARVAEQIGRLGSETLPLLRKGLAA